MIQHIYLAGKVVYGAHLHNIALAPAVLVPATD